MPGVRKATIKFDAKEAHVEYDASKATLDQMFTALKKIGYKSSLKSRAEGS